MSEPARVISTPCSAGSGRCIDSVDDEEEELPVEPSESSATNFLSINGTKSMSSIRSASSKNRYTHAETSTREHSQATGKARGQRNLAFANATETVSHTSVEEACVAPERCAVQQRRSIEFHDHQFGRQRKKLLAGLLEPRRARELADPHWRQFRAVHARPAPVTDVRGDSV